MHRWSSPPIPKTVYGGIRLGAIGLLRRVWRAHWNNTKTPESDAISQDGSQSEDSDEFRTIVANWIEQGTAEANSAYNVPVGEGALVPVVRRGVSGTGKSTP